MFRRKARGTFLQELGRSVGGVLASAGSFAFLKTTVAHYSQTPVVEQALLYRSTFSGGSGDLFAPFANPAPIMWIGVLLTIGGTVLRLTSYWRVAKARDGVS